MKLCENVDEAAVLGSLVQLYIPALLYSKKNKKSFTLLEIQKGHKKSLDIHSKHGKHNHSEVMLRI